MSDDPPLLGVWGLVLARPRLLHLRPARPAARVHTAAVERMTTDPAVTAAAEALALHVVALRRSDLTVVCDCGYDCDPCHFGAPWQKHLAAAAVAAARPIIEAEVRERIAAECRAEGFGYLATRVIAGGTA